MPYVLSDLQDTLDNTDMFNIRKCCLKEQKDGIINACEENKMSCTMYKFAGPSNRFMSQYDTQGGCFIDGCYTTNGGLKYVRWVHMEEATGISSDHIMHVNCID